MTEQFSVDVPLHYIQAIRLVQALLETGAEVHLPQKDATKFGEIDRLFGARPVFGETNVAMLPQVLIDHAAPQTTVGRITRPLIFPNYIFSYLRERWPLERPFRATFAGLLTTSRFATINDWLLRYDGSLKPMRRPSRAARMLTKVKERFNIDSTLRRTYGDVFISSSNRGRQFPGKAWDREYFDALLQSQFVLCPNGDYVWSYRFFEAAMCGAIPIVETECALFKGFRYLSMHDRLQDARWTFDDAQSNFSLVAQRLAVPTSELAAEIHSLLTLQH